MKQASEKGMSTISVEQTTAERVRDVALKASQVTGVRISRSRIVKALLDNYSSDLIRKYDAAVAALRKEKLI